jgi:hypothetical protein
LATGGVSADGSDGRDGVPRRKFKIILIKPSHYDADGYVIQWYRSGIPSNSLASVYGLFSECIENKVLGADVDIAIEGHDECNTIIDVRRSIKKIRAAGSGFVGPGRGAVQPVPARA